MSKKRFVEFYLSAMMKAATGGQVQRVAYLYYDLQHVEVVRIEYEHAHGGGCVKSRLQTSTCWGLPGQ